MPMLAAGHDLAVAEDERLGQHLEDPPRGLVGFDRLGLLDDDRELVAAQARDGVAGAGRRAQPFRDGDEQPVALGVAETVVDGLEVVEVEVQHGGRPPAADGSGQGVTEAVEEERAVRQTGQHVVERLVAELLLEGLSLGDVAIVDDDAADGRVVEQVLGDRLERSPRAVGVAGAELDRDLRAVWRPRRRRADDRRSTDRRGGRRRSPGARSRPPPGDRGSVRQPGSRTG